MEGRPGRGTRHLTLVDRKYLHYLTRIDRGMVHHFAGELSLCNEFDPGPEPEEGYEPREEAETMEIMHRQWATVREWLYLEMECLVSVGRSGRDDMVEVFTNTEEDGDHPDAGAAPPSVADMPLDPQRDARNGSRQAARIGAVRLK